MDIEKYCKFMFDYKNIRNCKVCPENKGIQSQRENQLPCGQYHCWVALSCNRGSENEKL